MAEWRTLDFEYDEPIGDPDPPLYSPIKYPDWHLFAKCAGLGTSHFFSDTKVMSISKALNKRAMKVCVGCDVLSECLTSALENKDNYGVWAGTTPLMRRRMLATGRPVKELVDEWVGSPEEESHRTDAGRAG